MQLTDGRQAPRAPTWHFWVLALLALPVAVIALRIADSATGVPEDLVMLGTTALSGYLLAHERAVRRMARRRRIVWAVIGCLLTAAVVTAASLTLFLVLLMAYCSEGC